jgi:glycopeptide antibiotics resistance protein
MRHGATSARCAYAAIILLATLTRLQPEFVLQDVHDRLLRALDTDLRPRDAVDAVRNIALFAGWGAVWILTGPPRGLARRVGLATLTGAALSVVVETVQLVSPARRSSILDVATNTAGAWIGAVIFALAIVALGRSRRARSYVGVPAFLFAGGYGAAAALEAFIPLFESATLPGASGGFVPRFQHALAHFEPASILHVPLLRFVLFVPAGAFAVAALSELGWSHRRSWPVVAAAGALLAVLVELLAAGAGHPVLAGAVLTHAAAIAVGAWAAARWLPRATQRLRGRQRPLALYAAYGVLLALWAWRPFVPETSLSEFLQQFSPARLTPLAAHAQRVDIFSVVDLARQFGLLIPLGALLAVWPVRRRGWLAGPLPGLYAAALLEAGQLLVGSRYFDITDVLVGTAAVLIGWAVVRRGGFPARGELFPGRGEPEPSAALR